MTIMTSLYGMDWLARCVVILVVLWKSVALVRAIQSRRPPEIWRQAAYALGFAALLSADLSLYVHPHPAVPWLRRWPSANLQHLWRWPRILFFAALASVVDVLAGPKGTAKGAGRAKAAGAALLALVTLLVFVEVTRFRCGISFYYPPRVTPRGQRYTVPEFNTVGIGPEVALARTDEQGGGSRTFHVLCFFWNRRSAIVI